MQKSVLLLICFGLLLSFAVAHDIPFPADSPEYQSYKESLVGQPIKQNPVISGVPQSINYERSTRNGLLIPLDDSFTMALGGNDDSYTSAINLPFTFDFYGSPQNHFYINNNGNVSFGNGYSTFTATGFPVYGYPMLAPFWADVDTRPTASGKVHYRIESHRVVVTWPNVGYFGNQSDKLNTFQLIFTDGTDPLIGLGNNVAFSYGDMQWTTGSASGGSGGFYGTPATVGINKGDGMEYALIGRFDHPGTDYNGPTGAASGVSFLDNQLFIFSSQQLDLPPFFAGMPTQAVVVHRSETRNLQIAAISSSPGKVVNANVLHSVESGFDYEIVPGNPCYININITGSLQNLGDYWIEILAYDDGEPPLQTNIGFNLRVINEPAQPGDYLLITDRVNASLYVLDINTDELYGPYLQGQLGSSNLMDVVISHRGDFALVSNFNNNTVYQVSLANPYNPVVMASFNAGFPAEDVSLSVDDRFALVADGGTQQYLAVIDLQSRAITQTIDIAPHYAQGVELGPDGKVLVNNCEQGRIHQYLLDLETGMLSYSGVSINVSQAINSVISPDGKYAIVCSSNSESQLLELNDDNSITVLQNLGFSSQSAVYSADQQMVLIYAYGDGQDKIMVFAVDEDATVSLQNIIPLDRYSTGGFYGVDVLAISQDKNWVYAGNSDSSYFPLVRVNLGTGEIDDYPLYNSAGIAMGSMGFSAFFNATVIPETDGIRVVFQNYSSGNPDYCLWAFGDGTTSTQWNPSHIYTQPGFYNVRLTVYKDGQSRYYEKMLALTVESVFYLNAASSPYYFATDLIVPVGATLIVESGVQVNFGTNAGLIVYGSLQAENAIFSGDPLTGWKGIQIDSRMDDIALVNCQIKNAVTALRAIHSSFQLTNLVVSKTQDFPLEKGLHLVGACNMQVNGLWVNGYRPGIVMNNQSRVASSPLLTNIRVRNSASTSRQENLGMEVVGAIALSLDNVEIEDYDNALTYDTTGYSLGRATALLTNIRVRNSANTSRVSQPAFKLTGANSIELNDVDIEDYALGIEMVNREANRATAAPLLTNIRVRNSGNTSREASVGLSLKGNISPVIEDSFVYDYATGILIDTEIPDRATNNALLTNIRIRNSGNSSREPFTGIKLKDLATANLSSLTIFAQDDSSRSNLAGSAIWMLGGNSNISRSTIWGLEHGLKLQNAGMANFNTSVIWTASGNPLSNPILVESGNAVVHTSNISNAAGVYPGSNNMAIDPCFVDAAEGDFGLRPRSPMRDLGIGAEDFNYAAYISGYSLDFAPGWNMTGVPFYAPAGEDTPVAFFGDVLSPFYVHPYYTSILQMNSFSISQPGVLSFDPSDTYSVPSLINPGPGYWIRNPNEYPLSVEINAILDREDFEMQLRAAPGAFEGFYMLANPYDVPISIDNGGIDLSPQFTGDAFIFMAGSSTLSPTNLSSGPITEIPPYAAFIIKPSADGSIFFKYPGVGRNATQRSPQIALQQKKAPQRTVEWEVFLQATAGDIQSIAVMGIGKNARDAYDPMDVPDLPFELSPAPLKLRVHNPDWEAPDSYYLRDIRSSAAESWSWPLKLEIGSLANAGSFNGEIKIGLKPGQKLPGDYSFHLLDPHTGELIDLKERSYPLYLDLDENSDDFVSWEYPLLVEVRKLHSEQDGSGLSLSNYPNPFNPSTTISFSLPNAGWVDMQLYNLKGQKVRSLLKGEKAAGRHSVVWDGKDERGLPVASGIYYCKVKSPSGSQVLKLMLLK